MTGLLIKNSIVDLPIKMKENSYFRQFVESVGVQDKDMGAASQTLLTEVKLRLRRRLTVRGLVVFGEIKNQFYIKRNRQIWPCN